MDWNGHKWKALADVMNVRDGDTIDVMLSDGTSNAIRWPGQNTPEKSMPNGMEARTRLVELLTAADMRVLCVAFDRGGSLSGDRVRWHPLHEDPTAPGHWVNAAVILGREGLTVPFPQKEEWAFNKAINAACLDAMERKVGLWSQPDSGLRVRATFNPEGGDAGNEYLDVTNVGNADRPIAGWSVRLSDAWGPEQRGYVFPDGAHVPAGRTVRVRIRPGDDTHHPRQEIHAEFFWDYGEGNLALPMNNPDDATGNGDMAILLRPDGTPAAWHTWLPT